MLLHTNHTVQYCTITWYARTLPGIYCTIPAGHAAPSSRNAVTSDDIIINEWWSLCSENRRCCDPHNCFHSSQTLRKKYPIDSLAMLSFASRRVAPQLTVLRRAFSAVPETMKVRLFERRTGRKKMFDFAAGCSALPISNPFQLEAKRFLREALASIELLPSSVMQLFIIYSRIIPRIIQVFRNSEG